MNMGIIAASRLRGAVDPMFGNAVAYYRLDETTGDAIDLVNGYNGTLNGSISRNGEYYTFDAENEYVEIADEDDFSFTDGNGNNTDFVIKTEVIFEGFNAENRSWLVSKRQNDTAGVRDWQFLHIDNEFNFTMYDESSNRLVIKINFTPNIGQKYIVGVTLIGSTLSLFVDGVILKNRSLPPYFYFRNGTSVVKLGDETVNHKLNFIGKMKETVIVKGNGWDAETISDNYNGGAGITYNL
jgi:hypothetical protein